MVAMLKEGLPGRAYDDPFEINTTREPNLVSFKYKIKRKQISKPRPHQSGFSD